jgi:hypothetical protein
MRQNFGAPYPLTHFKPFASGRRLLLQVQDQLDLPDNLPRHTDRDLGAAGQRRNPR